MHSGFLAAYDSVKAKIFRIVDQATSGRSADQPWKVFITGHSLGGALATLAAYDMAGRRWGGHSLLEDRSPMCLQALLVALGLSGCGVLALARGGQLTVCV